MFTSDGMKKYIREYKRRQREGMIEDMQVIIQSGSKEKTRFVKETSNDLQSD